MEKLKENSNSYLYYSQSKSHRRSTLKLQFIVLFFSYYVFNFAMLWWLKQVYSIHCKSVLRDTYWLYTINMLDICHICQLNVTWIVGFNMTHVGWRYCIHGKNFYAHCRSHLNHTIAAWGILKSDTFKSVWSQGFRKSSSCKSTHKTTPREDWWYMLLSAHYRPIGTATFFCHNFGRAAGVNVWIRE